MSNSLLNERPLIVLPSLAAMLNSLDEAVILQQIHYWIEKKQNYREGRYWVYNSMENWMQQFPWIKSRTTLTRYFNNLEKKGLLITGNYNKAGFDKTKWYTIDYSTLSDFEQRLYRTCTTNEQNLVNGMNRTCTTNTIDYTETTTENTTNKQKQAAACPADAGLSECFDKIWNLYPKKQGKKDAFRHYKAWRKKSKDNTDTYLLQQLDKYKAYLAANQWLHPMNGSTWFNGRFDDDYSTANSQGYQPQSIDDQAYNGGFRRLTQAEEDALHEENERMKKEYREKYGEELPF